MSVAEKQKVLAPNIFTYHDYRLFLKDWFEYLRVSKKVSMRKLAVSSGLAVGYLPMVMAGKRPLSEKALSQLESHLGLNKKSFQFLSHLRDLNESIEAAEMVNAYDKIKKFTEYKQQHLNEIETHRLLSAWYYVAIRELVNLIDFKLDAKWIQKKLVKKVPLAEIKKAIEFLTQTEYIQLDKSGNAYLPDKAVTCDGGVFKLSMAKFHEDILHVAAHSIHHTDRSIRNLTTHTMAIDVDQFDELNEILGEALTKIQKLGDKVKKPERVYQISLLAFPLSKENGDNDED